MALWNSALLESSGSINVGGHVTDSGDSVHRCPVTSLCWMKHHIRTGWNTHILWFGIGFNALSISEFLSSDNSGDFILSSVIFWFLLVQTSCWYLFAVMLNRVIDWKITWFKWLQPVATAKKLQNEENIGVTNTRKTGVEELKSWCQYCQIVSNR